MKLNQEFISWLTETASFGVTALVGLVTSVYYLKKIFTKNQKDDKEDD